VSSENDAGTKAKGLINKQVHLHMVLAIAGDECHALYGHQEAVQWREEDEAEQGVVEADLLHSL
jgi:hypothetical protein